MSHNNLLHLPTAEDKKKSRLSELPSAIDLPQEYMDIYNADIRIDDIDTETSKIAKNTQSLYDDAILRHTKKTRGDTSKPVSSNNLLGNTSQLIEKNNEVSNGTYQDGIMRYQNKMNSPASNVGTNTFVQDESANPNSLDYPAKTTNVQNSKNTNALPTENVLHNYAPTVPIITLSCLEKNAYNTGNGSEIVVLKSAGKSQQGQGPLSVDYYIDNLVIRNSISANPVSGTGSIYQILFDVTEPYGVSFIDALIKSAKDLGYKSHLSAVYNLRIEFKGTDDDGKPANNILYSTRNIPIKIFQVDMNIDAGVSVYNCQAQSFGNLALTDLYSHTQETVSCVGDTVGDLIENFMNRYTMNLEYLQTQENKKIKLADEYILDRTQSMEEILSAKIGYSDVSSLEKVASVSNLNPEISMIADNASNKEVSVPKGTMIQTFVEAVVKSSDFYRNQLKSDGTPITNKIKTLKLETNIKLGDDNGNGRFQYKILYILRMQEYASDAISHSASSAGTIVPVRTYDYLYTGNNKDVLNFDIRYNFSFYQATSYLKDKGNEVVSTAANGDTEDNLSNADKTSGDTLEGYPVEPQNIPEQSFIPGINSANGQAVEIMQQIIQDPLADLIATNIEILGDPFWIPQKPVTQEAFLDSFTGTPNTDKTGAVATDESEVVVQVNFKQPVDLDDETGLFKKLNDVDGFKGLYRVYLCESRFEGGIFTNLLQMVRVRNQPKKSQIGQSANSLGPETYTYNPATTIGQSANSTGIGTYSYNPATTIGQSANSLGAGGYSYNPATTIGQSANSIGSDSYVTGITTNNVTRVPIGSNIAGGKRSGFVPEGFSDDFQSNLPVPKIETSFNYYSQAETMARLVKQKQGKSSRIRGGI